MSIRSRAYRGEADFKLVGDLLIESRRTVEHNECWGVERWEALRYAGFVRDELAGDNLLGDSVRLWEDGSGRLVAAITPESPGDVHLQFDAAHRADQTLFDDMLRVAEDMRRAARPAEPAVGAIHPIHTYADERNAALRDVLTARSYRADGPVEVLRRRSLADPIPEPVLPAGYTIRTLRIDDRADLERYCATEIATFGKTIWTPETVRVLARASSYRADLDLVAVAPDGSHAAFATVWYDVPSHAGVFEPVGTHPRERRRGLALALLNEGLFGLRALGGAAAYVGTGHDSPANRLYEAAGFALTNVVARWTKVV